MSLLHSPDPLLSMPSFSSSSSSMPQLSLDSWRAAHPRPLRVLDRAPREDEAATKLQAIFRGRRSRRLHVERVRLNLPWSPFVPARHEAVAAMLRVAELQPGETLLDIGSGDGRVLLAAAHATPTLRAARGVEIDSTLVAQSTRAIHAQGLGDRVQVVHADWLDVAMHDVDVVTLFFLPHADMARLLQTKLRAGTRVVTYVFQIAGWTPDQVATTVPFMTHKGASSIFRYRVPRTSDASLARPGIVGGTTSA